jgi:hypothetical protein
MAANVQQVLTVHAVATLRPLVAREYLTTDGLMWLRGQLAAPSVWLPDDPALGCRAFSGQLN